MYEIDQHTLRFIDKNVESEFLEYYYKETIKYVRPSLRLGACLYAVFGILHWSLDREKSGKLLFVVGAIVFLSLAVTDVLSTVKYFKIFMQEALSILVLLGGLAVIYITVFASDPENNLYYVGLLLVLMYSFTYVRLRFTYAAFVSLLIIIVYDLVAWVIIKLPPQLLLVNNYYFLAAYIIGAVSAYRIECYIRTDFIQKEELKIEKNKVEAEKSKVDDLLMKIYPKSIADRLKNNPSEPIVDRSDCVTVLFADLVGFTKLSSSLFPRPLVQQLNEIFSLFDAICKKYGLEKIKTIGDGYLAVAGLPEARTEHAQMAAKAALRMQRQVRDLVVKEFDVAEDGKLAVRIGLHSGPVVAGVIQGDKPNYDVWGHTVNVANRMESDSESGKIQISEATFSRLGKEFECEAREMREIEGVGKMQTYFLIGYKESRA